MVSDALPGVSSAHDQLLGEEGLHRFMTGGLGAMPIQRTNSSSSFGSESAPFSGAAAGMNGFHRAYQGSLSGPPFPLVILGRLYGGKRPLHSPIWDLKELSCSFEKQKKQGLTSRLSLSGMKSADKKAQFAIESLISDQLKKESLPDQHMELSNQGPLEQILESKRVLSGGLSI